VTGTSVCPVDIGSACWARTSDPLINSRRVVALRANTCAEFTPKPSGKIEKFTTILCAFAGFVPERKRPLRGLGSELYGVDHLVPELAGWA
jgi:hypothetical protein